MTATAEQDRSETDEPSLIEQAVRHYRTIERSLARLPPARALAAIPRTGRFAGKTIGRRGAPGYEGPPVPDLSPALLANVAMDEALLLFAMGPNRFPRRADYERVKSELADALALFEERGWLDDPASYHLDPPPLERPQIQTGWAAGRSYERLWWDSGYEPHLDEPGRERWLDYATNHTAGAWVLRHDDGPRPWLVCVHGFGMGYPFMEFPVFDVARLHHELGLNLVGPQLPLHGRRKVTRLSGEAFLSFDMMNSVHGLAQSVWDLRRLLSWVRSQEPVAVGAYGVSLGSYVSSLLACHDDGLDAVIAGIPVSDFPALFQSHSPMHIRLRAFEHDILGGSAERVHRVVSPLELPPRVPRQGRFIYAGLGDRMSHPRQAWNLWRHWEEPPIVWYPGSHIGFVWSRTVRDFVPSALRRAGLTAQL